MPFDANASANIKAFRKELDDATKFIPLWVKVAVAIALGLGTMVGWRGIVVTFGEKIGKTHLTYAQGASADWWQCSPLARPTSTACRYQPPRLIFRRDQHHGG